jgi:hypothetical protein
MRHPKIAANARCGLFLGSMCQWPCMPWAASHNSTVPRNVHAIRASLVFPQSSITASTVTHAYDELPHRAKILLLDRPFVIIRLQIGVLLLRVRETLRRAAGFLIGIFLIFLKWPTIGVLVRVFGFLNLTGACALRTTHRRK